MRWRQEMSELTYPVVVQNLAAAARVAEGFGIEREAAVTWAAEDAVKEGRLAQSRGGHWRYESTTEQIEDAGFQAAVASDVLAGRSRPSVGNVREAVLAALDAAE